jgi:membrane protease YdiL (CAAX protease family)
MPDPTLPVISATYCLALGLFAVTAVVRRNKTPPLEDRVATHFYKPQDLAGIAFVFLGFSLLVISSLSVKAGAKDPTSLAGNLLFSILFQFVTAGIVTSFVIQRIQPVAWLGLRWRSWPMVFVIAPTAVAFVWGLILGCHYSGLMRWIESLGVETVQDTVKLLQTSTDPQILGLMIFAAVVAAPLCEEVVFRGYLYPACKRFAGPWFAGICTALVFAATHGSIAALVPLFALGCVLALVYQKTGSLWTPVAVHFCFNAATVGIQMIDRLRLSELTPP